MTSPAPEPSGTQNLIRMVKSSRAPIHDVGLQGHMTTGQSRVHLPNYISNKQAFANLGVEAAVGRRRLG